MTQRAVPRGHNAPPQRHSIAVPSHEGKGICIAPQATYCCCRGTVHVTDRVGVEPIGCRLSLCPQADLWRANHMQSGLPFNGLHLRNPCNCMDYYSFTDPGVGVVGWPIADTLPMKWSHVSHRSGKVCQPKTNALTTEPRRQPLKWGPLSPHRHTSTNKM